MECRHVAKVILEPTKVMPHSVSSIRSNMGKVIWIFMGRHVLHVFEAADYLI